MSIKFTQEHKEYDCEKHQIMLDYFFNDESYKK